MELTNPKPARISRSAFLIRHRTLPKYWVAQMNSYPHDRKKCGYFARFAKAIFCSDAIHEYGMKPVLMALFVAAQEDRLHYSKAPRIWRSQIMESLGIGSPKDVIATRQAAIEAGLIHYVEGSRITAPQYWSLVPDWLIPHFVTRSQMERDKHDEFQNGTQNGTQNGMTNGALSLPFTPNPKRDKSATADTLTVCLSNKVIQQWNNSMGQQCRLTPKRQAAIKSRWTEPWWRENWQTAIDRLTKSPFCRGENDRGWKADIDWFLKPDTATKILEGKYDSHCPPLSHPTTGRRRI